MKKKRKINSTTVKKSARLQTKKIITEQALEKDRRVFLRRMRNGIIVVSVLGGGGYLAVMNVQAGISEMDLSRVGNGRPSIVQIHDPQCPLCNALQKQARKALRAFNEDEIDYIVANIRTTEGNAFANKYLVPHVTLLLFDGEGELQKVLRGSNTSEVLEAEFLQHIMASR